MRTAVESWTMTTEIIELRVQRGISRPTELEREQDLTTDHYSLRRQALKGKLTPHKDLKIDRREFTPCFASLI